MKKTKLPGDNISLKTKKNEDPLVMQWLNSQTNLMDSLRYLVESEIAQNGVRNLQAFVPMERNLLQGNSGLPRTEGDFSPNTAALAQMAAASEASREAVPVPEPVVEEEIDDDDIEAWS
ncbi:hypothetical protein [Paenibacillus luteus]|uniref:hypothetical protein n=1 Tax=Paenibacillus luteus TaxID=2545753 RepID=UPI0011449331|nr:hypothetical protein [Paenibacillus luteus]